MEERWVALPPAEVSLPAVLSFSLCHGLEKIKHTVKTYSSKSTAAPLSTEALDLNN
jgi:hypothetical protein